MAGLFRLQLKNRRNIRELESEGISRNELRDASIACRREDGLPCGGEDGSTDVSMIALNIVAELMDNPASDRVRALNWDKIIELIEKLMPLIQAWISGCGI